MERDWTFGNGLATGYNDARAEGSDAKLIRIRKHYSSPRIKGYHTGWNQAIREMRSR